MAQCTDLGDSPIKIHVKRIVQLIICCTLLFCIGSIAAFGINLFGVVNSLDSVKAAAESGEFDRAAIETEKLTASCEGLSATLNSPFWAIAGSIPAIHDDLDWMRQLSYTGACLSRDVVQPLMNSLAGTSLDRLLSADHSIDISALDPALKTIQDTAPKMSQYVAELKNAPEPKTAFLHDAAQKVRGKATDYNALFQKASLLAPIISSVFDKDGSQTFLLVAQNSTETRSAGGFPGAMGDLIISHGKIELGDFATPYDLLSDGIPSDVKITDEEIEIFDGVRMARSRDVNFNPDFPRVASIWAADYEDKNSRKIDGVISVVPCVVQKLLAVSGPITLSDGTELNGDNATRILQHDMYWQYLSGEKLSPENAELIDKLFAEAAQLAFDKFFSSLNAQNIASAAKVFLEAFDNREIMLWFSEPTLEERILTAGFGGALNSNPSDPVLGVFASLSIASKLGWYLDIDTKVAEGHLNPDGTTTYHVESIFTNTATEAEVNTGGSYIMGNGRYRPVGDMSLYIYLFAPANGCIQNFEASESRKFATSLYNNLEVTYIHHLNLEAGDSVRCRYDVVAPAGIQQPLTVMTVPTLTEYR